MEMEIIKMNDSTWRIEDHGVRFFLLEGTERALLIDSGMTIANAKEIAESLTSLPVSLLNTHADMDHVGSNGEFASFYMHPAEEDNYRRGGRTGQILPVQDGDVLDLGNRKLEIIHLPGHTPGSIAVWDPSYRVLFSGDPVQRNGRIFMFGEFRNLQDYVNSLRRLEKRAEEFEEIWPSHADLPLPAGLIQECRKAAEKILASDLPGCEIEMHGRKVTAIDAGFTTFLCEA